MSSIRECLTSLIEQAKRQAENDPDSNRRRKHRRLLSYLTRRLARVIVREASRERTSHPNG